MAAGEGRHYERRTWPELKRLAKDVPEAGIHFQSQSLRLVPQSDIANANIVADNQSYRRDKDFEGGDASEHPLFDHNPWFKDLFDGFRSLEKHEVPAGYDSGTEFQSVCLNTSIYLHWLLGQCLKAGVVVKRGILTHLREAKTWSHTGQPADIVVNATALGSLKLGGVEDKTLAPARGQIVVVRNECTPMMAASGTNDEPTDLMYLMQRAGGGGTVLGGTYDIGNWESVPDPNIAIRIMKRVVEARPEIVGKGQGIEGLSIVRHAVGLRPWRKDGVRLEREKISTDGLEIVHNYGHAGWGYQGSYGCAERVVELVNEIRAERGEKLDGEPKLFIWDS